MKRTTTTLLLLLLLVSVAYAARCSTGQQLYSIWQNLVEDAEILEDEAIPDHEKAYKKAEDEMKNAQYAVTFHMGFHGCNDPDDCDTLQGLVDNLESKIDAASCISEELERCRAELETLEDETIPAANEAWIIHRYTCGECD